MSRTGRAGALGAVVLAVITVAAWDVPTRQESSVASADGARLFRAKGCAGCHDGPATMATIGGFPPLRDAADWAGQRRPGMTARAYLAESIEEPGVFVSPAFAAGDGPTTAMPELRLTPAEVDALIDHLLSG